MIYSLPLTDEETSRIRAAREKGIDVDALVRGLISGLPEEVDIVQEKFVEVEKARLRNEPSVARLREQLAQTASLTPEEVTEAERELEQFQNAVNAERDRAKARRVF